MKQDCGTHSSASINSCCSSKDEHSDFLTEQLEFPNPSEQSISAIFNSNRTSVFSQLARAPAVFFTSAQQICSPDISSVQSGSAVNKQEKTVTRMIARECLFQEVFAEIRRKGCRHSSEKFRQIRNVFRMNRLVTHE
jgi:hypothetical protein